MAQQVTRPASSSTVGARVLNALVFSPDPDRSTFLVETLRRAGFLVALTSHAPTSKLARTVDTIVIDAGTPANSLPSVVQQALDVACTPVLVIGERGEALQATSPRLFVARVSEMGWVLQDIIAHLISAPGSQSNSA